MMTDRSTNPTTTRKDRTVTTTSTNTLKARRQLLLSSFLDSNLTFEEWLSTDEVAKAVRELGSNAKSIDNQLKHLRREFNRMKPELDEITADDNAPATDFNGTLTEVESELDEEARLEAKAEATNELDEEAAFDQAKRDDIRSFYEELDEVGTHSLRSCYTRRPFNFWKPEEKAMTNEQLKAAIMTNTFGEGWEAYL